MERPGVGDITRGQLRDVKGADSLYFTMLNGSKRSITIDSKNPKGKEILDRLVRHCDVLVENFAPGALDRKGLTWEHIHKLNPRMIVASVKGFGPGPYEGCKVYENVAQCAGGGASTDAAPTPDVMPYTRRWSAAPRSAIPAPVCISRLASSRRSISACAPGAASACWPPCRTAS